MVFWQKIPIYIIYPICFHGKYNCSSEDHESPKTNRGSYLGLLLFIFDKIVEFSLVNQSL